jgi:hypothetical protein
MGTGHNVVLAPGYNQTRLSQTTSLWHERRGGFREIMPGSGPRGRREQ